MKFLPLITSLLLSFVAISSCGPTTPKGDTPEDPSKKTAPINGKEDTIDNKGPKTFTAREFTDNFVEAQKCILSREIDPTEYKKAAMILDRKKNDKAVVEAAYKKLAIACRKNEVPSMYNYFSCHRTRCGDKPVENCVPPKTSLACEGASREFFHYFFPF